MRWQDQALCAEIDPDMWFPGKGHHHTAKTAKRICQQWCPVREPCLAYAIAHPELIGIWGGTSTRERQRIRDQETA